jgi:hypothetical protein
MIAPPRKAHSFPHGFFANVALNLKARGPAAAFCVWCACVAALGVFGKTSLAYGALGVLSVVGGALVTSLGSRS